MRILLGAWHATGFAGTQSWVYTVAHALRELGHEVSVLVTARREMAMRLISAGFEVYSTVKDDRPACDLVIASQPRMLHVCPICRQSQVPNDDMTMPKHTDSYVAKKCLGSGMKGMDALPKVKRLYVCHGWLPHEKPVLDGTPYVAVSPEVATNLKSDFSIDATVIGQPIDFDRFRPVMPLRMEKPKALVLSTWPASPEHVASACEEAGVEIFVPDSPGGCWNMPGRINKVDIVIGTGRGIAEAMACGRVACICGQFGCDGLVTPGLIEKQAEFNFSGRWKKGELPNALMDALKGYDPVYGRWGTIEAHKRFAPLGIAQALLEAA